MTLNSALFNFAKNIQFERGHFTMQERIDLPPKNPEFKLIGRILGPRGISLRQLEAETHCKIVIRGKGSVKDPEKESKLRGLPGWEHLDEELHVLITAQHPDKWTCSRHLHYAIYCIGSLLTPQFDAYKKEQLLQLAILNGTYQPRSKSSTNSSSGSNNFRRQQPRRPLPFPATRIPSLLSIPTNNNAASFYSNSTMSSATAAAANWTASYGSACSLRTLTPLASFGNLLMGQNSAMNTGAGAANHNNNSYLYRSDFAQYVRYENGQFTMQERIKLPENPDFKVIGRILGPRGISLRQLEVETRCRIAIRGKGSVKDSVKEGKLRGLPGWEHLGEELHVLITAQHQDQLLCSRQLNYAAHCIKSLLTPRFDAYKKEQLLLLAILNGSYKPRC